MGEGEAKKESGGKLAGGVQRQGLKIRDSAAGGPRQQKGNRVGEGKRGGISTTTIHIRPSSAPRGEGEKNASAGGLRKKEETRNFR